MEKSKTFTIGLIVGGIRDPFTISLCKGAIKAAKEIGVKLIILPAKYLDRDYLKLKELMYDYQYNTLFSYAQKGNVDAVLVAADSIGFCTTRDRVLEMLSKYADIPCILIASRIEGYISINYDNKSGVREGLEYLIHHLKCKKIGMIGGPDDNTDAFERKQAYLETLAENNIPFEDRFYIEGRLSRFEEATFEAFIDRNPDIEAVFCVNDDTAVGFYEVLKRRNIQPGKQIMVFGYDNIPLSTKMKPALSSISADKTKLGKVAVEQAVKMLRGEEVTSVVLPTKFIRRDSIRADIEDAKEDVLAKAYIDNWFQNLISCYEGDDSDEQYAEMKNAFIRFIEKLVLVYEGKVSLEEEKEALLILLEEFLTNEALEYADIEQIVSFMQQIYEKFKEKYEASQVANEVTVLLYGRMFLATNRRYIQTMEKHDKTSVAMKVLTRDIMQFIKGNDQSYMSPLQNLSWFNIENAYIYIFEKPVINVYQEEFILPDRLYLMATLKNGEIKSIPAINQETLMKDIFAKVDYKEDSLPKILFPLYSNESVYGVILCDMVDTFYETGDFFVNQMSAAVKVIDLLKTNETIQEQLEDSILTLKENNIELNSLSRQDTLTGIFNRRGFYDAAETLVQYNRKFGCRTLVAYVDMNNLKIVNDRYGHDEGDFSIKKIAEFLQEVVGEKGVVGRLGGDEFAFVMVYENECDMKKEIYSKFQAYNKTSPKEYNVSVSAGLCLIEPDSEITLGEALTHADEMMYEEKKHKVKKVTK